MRCFRATWGESCPLRNIAPHKRPRASRRQGGRLHAPSRPPRSEPMRTPEGTPGARRRSSRLCKPERERPAGEEPPMPLPDASCRNSERSTAHRSRSGTDGRIGDPKCGSRVGSTHRPSGSMGRPLSTQSQRLSRIGSPGSAPPSPSASRRSGIPWFRRQRGARDFPETLAKSFFAEWRGLAPAATAASEARTQRSARPTLHAPVCPRFGWVQRETDPRSSRPRPHHRPVR